MLLPEVLIIGSGPAACAAALRSRQLGLSVVLLCPEEKPYTASESIHPGLQVLLNSLGIETPPENYSTGVYTGIYGNGGYMALDPGGSASWEGHHIDKIKFNQTLRNTTENAGCQLISQTALTLLSEGGRILGVATKNKSYPASYVIDCSGRAQMTGRFLKLKKKYYSPPLTAWSGRSQSMGTPQETSFFANHDHWNWTAPEQNGACSWTRLAKKGWKDFSPPPALSGYAMDGTPTVWNVRWRVFRPIVAPGLLLCGDAAGIIDPAASQGILTALMSGIAAANCIGDIFRQPSTENFFLARYDQWFLTEYENRAAQLRSYYKELLPDWYEENWNIKTAVNHA